jgi:hypothetical protein
MSQFLVLIRSEGNPTVALSAEAQQAHVAAARTYIASLAEKGHLKSALPLEMAGMLLRGARGEISTARFAPDSEPVAGYYLLEAAGLEAAVELAKGDPRFSGAHTWSMEIRPILRVAGISD